MLLKTRKKEAKSILFCCNFSKNYKGQITIFIIVGILVVAIAFLVLYLLNQNRPESSENFEENNPESFLSFCIEEDVETNIEALSKQGGYVDENPLSIRFKFENEPYYNVSYLCYSNTNSFCVIQEPSVINHLEKELENSIEEISQKCFKDYRSSLEAKNYDVIMNYTKPEANLVGGNLILNFNTRISFSKGEDIFSVNNVSLEFPTNLYGISKVVQRIIQDETNKGSFDLVNYHLIYPEYYIDYKLSDSSRVYVVRDENTNEEFRFAVKGGNI